MCCQGPPKPRGVPRGHAGSLRKRVSATLNIVSLSRHVELRKTLKNLAQAHPGEFQVLCDIDCRSLIQLRESWRQQSAAVALLMGGLGEGGWVHWSDVLHDLKELCVMHPWSS